VTLIALLIAILLPALRQARTAARLVVCASNQRQIANGAFGYATENRGRLMITRQSPFTSSGRHPEYINTDPNSSTDEWNLHRIQPYVSGFDLDSQRARGVMICPNVNADFYAWLAQFHWNNWWADPTKRFTQLSYGYYAGVDRWDAGEARNGAERELADSRPGGANRVLISDILFPDPSTGIFRYNHGRDGWAWSWPPIEGSSHYGQSTGAVYETAPPSITGLNQAFADGSVQWKDAGQIATDQMHNTAAYPDGWVDRGGDSPAFY